MVLPSLTPFAPCPSCGGWARRPLAPRESRAHCKGCGWRGVLGARVAGGPAPPPPEAPAGGPARPEDPRLPPPGFAAWRGSRFHS